MSRFEKWAARDLFAGYEVCRLLTTSPALNGRALQIVEGVAQELRDEHNRKVEADERAAASRADGQAERAGAISGGVRVVCGNETARGVCCGWSGYRRDGAKVAAPCPHCGGPIDVFRRGDQVVALRASRRT